MSYQMMKEDNLHVLKIVQKKRQQEWLDSLSPEALKNLSIQLAKTLRTIGDQFDIMCGEDEE
jgi:hypothetical protein